MTDTDIPITDIRKQLKEVTEAKDSAYWERNQLVAVLTKIFPAWIGYHSDPDWENDWRNIIYMNIPVRKYLPGVPVANPMVTQWMQVSWHIHDSDLKHFKHLEKSEDEEWDGHTTEEKYRRLNAIDTNVLMFKPKRLLDRLLNVFR